MNRMKYICVFASDNESNPGSSDHPRIFQVRNFSLQIIRMKNCKNNLNFLLWLLLFFNVTMKKDFASLGNFKALQIP